jgi:signal transduction histidine kinase
VAETEQVTGERLACDLDLADYQPQPFEVEEALYRVFREALHNVSRYARANWVRIRLSCEGGSVMLRIADDGVGFDPDAVPPREPDPSGYTGLCAPRARVERLGGTLRTHSQPSRGTTVDVLLPCRGRRGR